MNEGYETYESEHPGVSKQQLETRINISLYLSYAKAIILIITGVMAGFFIFKHKRIGRILALVLCILMLGSRLFALLTTYPNIVHRLEVIYVFLLSQMPVAIIHKDIVAPIFFILSIIYLFKKSVVHTFMQVTT